jgi:thiamine-monophosphate kinase
VAQKESSEWAKIALLQALLEGPGQGRVGPASEGDAAARVGIGDDAAVLPSPGGSLVWTVDAAVDGVHFRRDLLTLDDIGYRSTMAAASDLAAMGASPLGLLAALILPADFPDDALASLARGQRAAADALGTAVIGGNLSRGSELSITTTALGEARRPLLRRGARPGDRLWMAGPVGLAAAGLRLLLTGAKVESEAAQRAVSAWRRPRALLAEGQRAAAFARAAIDVSDGLAQDLGHLGQASEVSALLDGEALVSPELAEVARELGRDPEELALHGGEDYALVIALPAERTIEGFRAIGWIEEQASGRAAVRVRGPRGDERPVTGRGFDHFRR